MAEEVELRTAGGTVIRKIHVLELESSENTMLSYDENAWTTLVSGESSTDEEIDPDLLLISERRRMMLVIEEVVGPRLKPQMVERIVEALQKEGFRQD